MAADTEFIRRLIEQHTSFVLTTHVNPDGDGLGSELAMAHLLRKLGKKVHIINDSTTPGNYGWLDAGNEIVHFLPGRDQTSILEADVIFILDTNQPERLRSMEWAVLRSKAKKIVIDHHLEAHPFADHYLIDVDATSTGEIVYKVIRAIDGKLFDRDIARSLYTAIMTDTGSFRYPRTDPETHRIVSHLVDCGADPTEIFASVYEDWSLGRMRLLGEMLDSMKSTYDGKLAYVVCTKEMFQRTGTSEVETDNFTTYPMSVRGVVVGILFNELKDSIKISFRSKGSIPINELAKEFGGNGHLNAAGALLHDVKLDETVKLIVERARKYLAS